MIDDDLILLQLNSLKSNGVLSLRLNKKPIYLLS